MGPSMAAWLPAALPGDATASELGHATPSAGRLEERVAR
eukprot:COSAG01_NODE_44682_length_416_cov_1.611987_1_plen_38_part_01